MPSREDIDPAEIVPLLPDLVLLNVEWDPFRCRVRLRGTRAEQFRPIEKTTKYLDEGTIFDPGRREDYIAEMKFVATSKRPAFARDWMTTRFGAVREIYAGIWPLASDGTRGRHAGRDRGFRGPFDRRFRLQVERPPHTRR